MSTVRETAASLRVKDEELDPDDITRLLDTEPDIARRKGDERRLKSGGTVVQKTGVWILSTNKREPGDLDAQIADLLKRCQADIPTWRALTSRYETAIFSALYLHEANQGLCVSAATLKALGDRGIGLDLDIYSVADE